MSATSRKIFRKKMEREIIATFEEFDSEEQGWLNYQQVVGAVKRLGLFAQGSGWSRIKSEQNVLQKVWAGMDPSQSGAISQQAFVHFLMLILHRTSERERGVYQEKSETSDVVERYARELSTLASTKLSYTQTGKIKGHTQKLDQ